MFPVYLTGSSQKKMEGAKMKQNLSNKMLNQKYSLLAEFGKLLSSIFLFLQFLYCLVSC